MCCLSHMCVQLFQAKGLRLTSDESQRALASNPPSLSLLPLVLFSCERRCLSVILSFSLSDRQTPSH